MSLACSGAMYAGVPTAPREVASAHPFGRPGHAEVDHPRPVRRDQHVRRLQVPVHQARRRGSTPAPPRIPRRATGPRAPAAGRTPSPAGPATAPARRRWPARAGRHPGRPSTTAAVKNPLTLRAAATSCANRVRNPASSASSTLIVFTATSRPAAERPRYTWPIAPAPRRPRITYGPIRSGSHRRSGCPPQPHPLPPTSIPSSASLTPNPLRSRVQIPSCRIAVSECDASAGALQVGGERYHDSFGKKVNYPV